MTLPDVRQALIRSPRRQTQDTWDVALKAQATFEVADQFELGPLLDREVSEF
jgi:hypothetical protein